MKKYTEHAPYGVTATAMKPFTSTVIVSHVQILRKKTTLFTRWVNVWLRRWGGRSACLACPFLMMKRGPGMMWLPR
ncbi:hypothetical protein [Scandinavium lactucae]|uniref:Uncharacterized protein n=1 Tax=Scandinavium lactucae TaxID=3095028 RepID=A0ABU4QPI4_9ENTR|nr:MULTISPECIES: hypothetical protein [unclassified Scandinavium]MDX6041210.1 hypothetical protein [Scandinavium sp. V105_6]MDX6049728.1 hypothetical protein [Scandinavium sp. V105_1]